MDLQEEAAEVLSRLIRFDTVNPPGNERACQEWLRGYLEDAGLECELLGAEDPSGRTSSRGWAARPGPVLGYLCTSTPCSPTRPTGATTRGPARSTTASSGAAARWT